MNPKKIQRSNKNQKNNPKPTLNIDDDYFIGMNDDNTKYENNREVIKKIKKMKEKEKKIKDAQNSKKRHQTANMKNKVAENYRAVNKSVINENVGYENTINKKAINNSTEKKNAKKKKKINKLNKKLLKEQKEKQKELKRIEKLEAKRRKQEKIKNLSPKELRKRKARKIAIKYSFVFVLFIFAVILFLLSPVFYIKNIEVEGNSKISSEQIKALLQINSTTNIFEESNNKVNAKLKENKYIEKADVRRILPSTLKVNVVEREVEYLLEYANSYAYTDKNGNILEVSANPVEGKVKIIGYSTKSLNEQEKLDESDIEKLNNVKSILQSAEQFEIRNKITSINIADQDDYQIYIESEKKIVHLGDTKNLDTKMIYIKAILEKEKGNDGEIFVNMDLNKKQPYFRQNV
jgi:cell division protein FtsQ